MLLIYIILFVVLIGAAKRRRRKMGRYIRGNVDEELTLAALAAKDVIGAGFDEAVDDRTLVSSIVATYSLGGFTDIADVGPIMVGVAHSDYNDAEIEAYIEGTGQWNESDIVATREISRRLIRRIGTFPTPVSAVAIVVLNDGKPIKTKLNWLLAEGQTLRLWVYNTGTQNVATTVPVVNASGHVNLFPR